MAAAYLSWRTPGFTAETRVLRKNPFSPNEQGPVFDFIETDFAILMVFEFFLMTAEDAEWRVWNEQSLCTLSQPLGSVKNVSDVMQFGGPVKVPFPLAAA